MARFRHVVLIGTRGRTGLGRTSRGSVPARLLAPAPFPVLTVRGR
jgi:nucleotide-binding universal stress UspA family protein